MKLLFKGMTLLAAASMLVVSCVEEQMQEQETKTQWPDITAITASDDAPTRVSVTEPENGRRSIVWDKGDSISVFYRNSFLQKYVLDGEGGTTHGKFKHKSGIGLGTEFAKVYAAYPYDRNMTINKGVLRTTFPSEQTYREDNFDAKANLMVGVAAPGETTPFKNVGGYLVLQFYGTNAKVKSVVVASNGSERLAGPVEIGVKAGQAPTAKVVETTVRPIVKSADELVSGSGEVVLTCKDSVAIGATAETATSFWFVLLPQELKDGFTVQVNYNGGLFALSQKSSVEIERSAVLRMDPVELKAPAATDFIAFRDKNLKAHLVANGVDTDKDGEISYKEAAAVTALEEVFACGYESEGFPFTSFDEFCFFTKVERLVPYQFLNWTELKSIRLPAGLKEIGPSAFQSCYALESIEIPGNVKTVGTTAFCYCSSLSSVRINPGVERIQEQAFYRNTSLKSIVIPEGVVYVGYSCFSGCSSLQSVSLPGTLKEIMSGSFSYLSSLTEVKLAPGLKKINAGAFQNSGITSIVVPGSVEEVGSDCFAQCSNLTSVVFEDGIKKIRNCFGANASLKSVVFPGTLEYIPESICAGISSLKDVTLKNGPKYIGGGAFAATGITSVTVPGSVDSVASGAFNSCGKLETIVFEKGVRILGSDCLSGCTSLKKASFAGTIETILGGICSSCHELSELTLGSGIKVIEAAAFYDCALTAVEIPGSVEVLGSSAFGNCSKLKTVKMNPGTKTIGSGVFMNAALESFAFPGTIQEVPRDVFEGCSKLQAIDFKGVKTISDGACYGLSSLKSATFYEGLEKIGAAFGGTVLTSIVLPASIKEISAGAFNCPYLAKVTFLGTTVPTMNPGSFNSGVTISYYVPASALEDYKASGLSYYADHIFPSE